MDKINKKYDLEFLKSDIYRSLKKEISYLYHEKDLYDFWKAGQEYWKTSGATITFEEMLEQLKIKKGIPLLGLNNKLNS